MRGRGATSAYKPTYPDDSLANKNPGRTSHYGAHGRTRQSGTYDSLTKKPKPRKKRGTNVTHPRPG